MSYAVKEVFRTVQGEGHHAGTPAVFVRLAGCNMWSGDAAHRERDAARNGARCPLWCDTDFVGGFRMTRDELVARLDREEPTPLVVITGGEPLLQVDDSFIEAVHDACPEARIAIETNGTVQPKFNATPINESSLIWLTMSPKRARAATVLKRCSELKLVWPAHDPAEWLDFPAFHHYLQPQADQTIRQEKTERECAELVASGFRWKLSLQTHKIVGIR